MNENVLNNIENEIISVMQTKVRKIIETTRKNMVVVEEKQDGDSATIADVEIGKLFENFLIKLIDDSIVIQEESFDEGVYNDALKKKYVWVVDPIDGTKAFRDPQNTEWCVGVCLLENLTPILSFIYVPENFFGDPVLLSANKYRKNLWNFGKNFNNKIKQESLYVSHIHRDTERNDIENKIARLFCKIV